MELKCYGHMLNGEYRDVQSRPCPARWHSVLKIDENNKIGVNLLTKFLRANSAIDRRIIKHLCSPCHSLEEPHV